MIRLMEMNILVIYLTNTLDGMDWIGLDKNELDEGKDDCIKCLLCSKW